MDANIRPVPSLEPPPLCWKWTAPSVGLSSLGINREGSVRGWSNMELHGWQQCQRKPSSCTGTLSLLPPSWDTISSIYNQVLKLVSKFPYSKRLVLYFAYRGTTVKLDLGDVKAAGVVCILGLGVGLGTLYIYRLYHQYIRPFLDDQYTDSEDSSSDCSHLADSSDSGVDGAMGNNKSSAATAAVYYSPQYGVALGGRGLSPQQQMQAVADSVRLRRTGTRPKPVVAPRRDFRSAPEATLATSPSTSTTTNHLSPASLYETNVRDSFYSTAESGFETLPEGNEDDEESSEGEGEGEGERGRGERLLRENCLSSPRKGRGGDRHLSASSGGSLSGGKTVVHVSASETTTGGAASSQDTKRLLSAKSSPAHKASAKSSPAHKGGRTHPSHSTHTHRPHGHSDGYDYDDYDPSLDASESIRSFNSSGEEDEEEISWEEGGGGEGGASPFPPAHTAMSDREFRQSLMQRIRDWSAFAHHYGKSRSPTPECSGISSPHQQPLPSQEPPPRMRRSHSLDRHLGQPSFEAQVEIASSEPLLPAGEEGGTTIRHLECLETQFHDIQDEFESITSKLHELIERGEKEDPSSSASSSSRAAAGGGGGGRGTVAAVVVAEPPRLPGTSPRPSPRLQRPRDGNARPANPSPPSTPVHRPRTKWERLPSASRSDQRTKQDRAPSVARSDSSRSSRASSVELCWDCGLVGMGEVGGEEEEEVGRGPRAGWEVPPRVAGPGGDCHDGTDERDQASCLGEDAVSDRVACIGEAVSITDYADKEWKGETPKAKTIKQGYYSIPQLFPGRQRLRQIRGDNYCGLRSALFQVLTGGHKVSAGWPGLISIVDGLHALNADPASGLQHWNFARRLSWQGEDDRFSQITHCVLSLYATIEEMCALPTEEERLARTLSLLNGSQQFDAQLMEGLKLMMLFRANDLQRQMRAEADVPIFAWLLFARDTSADIVGFVRNHLNCVGDSAGIDQVEMCLLADCLGVTLRVARLDHFGQDEFDCRFPDDSPPDCPSVCLLAEDDRHYNVPVA